MRWSTAALLVVALLACLGRETGYYDFHIERANANSTWTSNYSNLRYQQPPLSLVRWNETPQGIQLEFNDGTTGLMTVEESEYSGIYYFPLYKRIGFRARTTFQTSNHEVSGEMDGKTSVSIFGVCSIRFTRRYARTLLLNQMLQDLAKKQF